jgi:hypothetical protein
MRTYAQPTLLPIRVGFHTAMREVFQALSMLFRLTVVRLLVEGVLLGICLSLFVTTGTGVFFSHAVVEQPFQFGSYFGTFTALNTGIFLTGVSVICLLYIVAVSLIQIATIVAVSKKGENSTLAELFHISISRFLPFVASQLFCFFLVIGGFFAFTLPGIGMLLFFMFVPYVVLFEGKSGFSAIQRSITLIASHPLPLIGRFLLLWTVGLLVNSVMWSLLFSSLGYLPRLFLITILNVYLWWYSTAYVYVLYKEAVMKTVVSKSQSLRSVLTLSFCGWGIAVCITIQVFSFVSTIRIKDLLYMHHNLPAKANESTNFHYDMSFGTKKM